VELEQSYPAIRAQGLGLAAVSYDSVEVLKSFADRKQITFPLLSDPDSKIIRAYGILNETVEKTNQFYGIPNPGTYVLDANGVVVAKYFEDDYKERETASSILVRQFGLTPPGPHAVQQAKQMSYSTSASTQTIATGEHVALVIDIELKPKMHVYAPGVEHYIAIDWQLDATEAAKSEAVTWPKPEILHLDAINETVPVYKDKLHLVREIIFAPDAKLKALLNEKNEVTIKGTLKYQACDDRMCYVPATAPVQWTFIYQPLDRQRYKK
jgi:AhpC/TSA family/Disulphide bond corrector protein DsbC